MRGKNNFQLELFSQSKNSGEIKSRRNNAFLDLIWNYEKTILIIICLCFTGIASFALGVEKGKRLALLKNNSRLDVALNIETPKAVAVNQAAQQQPQQGIPEGPGLKDYSKKAYTIQLASYRTRTYAQKEAKELKNKGLSPLVLSKGNYTVLCVGNFTNKEKAQPLLSELKKRYQGCYIRRL